MWNQQSILLHDNAPAHRSVLVKDTLAKNNLMTLENLPHCPVLAAPDFTCSLDWNKHRRNGALVDAIEIIKNATEEL